MLELESIFRVLVVSVGEQLSFLTCFFSRCGSSICDAVQIIPYLPLGIAAC